MKLSVIIVSYNEKEYLRDAIDSCLQQVCDFEYEIIIGDDGSKDGSIEIVKEYENNYPSKVRYFIMDRNHEDDVIPSLRVSNVIKRAMQMSKGEYITLLSGDDLFVDMYKFDKQISFLDKNKEYVSCYTGYKKFWNDGKEEQLCIARNVSRVTFWSKCYVHISSFVFRREVEKYLLDRFCDDTGLIYSIFRCGKSIQIPDISFGYRQRDASIIHNSDDLELNIMELALLQDIKNKKGYMYSSLARFSQPLKYVYKHRKKLNEKKYLKYIKDCENYEHNYLGKMNNYDKLNFGEKFQLNLMIYSSIILKYIFKILYKVEILL